MFGYDAIHANIGAIPTSATYVFGYVSGSPNIVWTQADFNKFPKAHIEYIDQGNGTPWRRPTVIDIENGAHTPSDIHRLASMYPGVKVYCNRSTIPDVYATGWRGNIWVAAPGSDAITLAEAIEREFRGLKVIAVQDTWTKNYDRSTILTPPVLPPPPVPTVEINGFKVPAPTANHIPVVISWWGSDGIVHRQTTFNRAEWQLLKWVK